MRGLLPLVFPSDGIDVRSGRDDLRTFKCTEHQKILVSSAAASSPAEEMRASSSRAFQKHAVFRIAGGFDRCR
jgi:hypothetical protein